MKTKLFRVLAKTKYRMLKKWQKTMRKLSNKKLLLKRKSIKLKKLLKSSKKVKKQKNQARNLYQRKKLLRKLRVHQKFHNMNHKVAFTFTTINIIVKINHLNFWFLKYPKLINMHQNTPVYSILISKTIGVKSRTRKNKKKQNLRNNGTMMRRHVT